MKFLGWLFSIESRHRHNIWKYKKGVWGRILTAVILPLIFLGASIGLTFFSYGYYKENVLLAILFSILTAALVLATLDYCGVFSIVAFKQAIWGTAYVVASYADKRRAKREGVSVEQISGQPEEDGKKRTLLDVFLGLFNILLFIGLIVAEVAIFMNIHNM